MGEHSFMFDFVKSLYDGHANIDLYVPAWITKEEYEEITGHEFGADETKYYLYLLDHLYLSLDDDKNIRLAEKDNTDYQQTFTQSEIDTLKENKEIKEKIDLEVCKVIE